MAALTAEHQVANLALGLIGQRQFLDSLTEASTEAIVARNYYAQTRNELLAAWRWRFATKRTVLALTTQARSGWTYTYAAPADMLAPQYIYPGTREPGQGEQIPFAWELNDAGDGFLILTDQSAAELVYTRELTTVALFPPYFVKALAAQLAVYLAGALPVKPQLIPMLESGARIALQAAAAIDGNAATRDELADAESIRVR
jgi:hypothetical protein